MLLSVKEDEIAVLFIPYPLVVDCRDSILLQFTADPLSIAFKRLQSEGFITCKDVLFIYPSTETEDMILRNAISNEKEYIEAPELSEIIRYYQWKSRWRAESSDRKATWEVWRRWWCAKRISQHGNVNVGWFKLVELRQIVKYKE